MESSDATVRRTGGSAHSVLPVRETPSEFLVMATEINSIAKALTDAFPSPENYESETTD